MHTASRGVLSSGTWAPRETSELVLHNQCWSWRLLCKPASNHKNREHTLKALWSHTRWLLPSWLWVINNFIKNVLSTCFYLYMYLTRNYQGFRGKFLFPFLFIAQKKTETEKKKNCLWLVAEGLSMSISSLPSLRFIRTVKAWNCVTHWLFCIMQRSLDTWLWFSYSHYILRPVTIITGHNYCS